MVLSLAFIFQTAAAQFNLPPGLLEAVCFVESKHIVTAIHHDDGNSPSYGLCQVKLETAQWLGFNGTADDLMKPHVNAYYAAKYLARNLRRYGTFEKAVIAYNRGNAGNLTTNGYQTKVFNRWREFSYVQSRR